MRHWYQRIINLSLVSAHLLFDFISNHLLSCEDNDEPSNWTLYRQKQMSPQYRGQLQLTCAWLFRWSCSERYSSIGSFLLKVLILRRAIISLHIAQNLISISARNVKPLAGSTKTIRWETCRDEMKLSVLSLTPHDVWNGWGGMCLWMHRVLCWESF